MLIIIYVFTFLVFFFAFFSIVITTLYYGISPMPSSRKAKQAILQLIQEIPKAGEIVDLGSGFLTLALPIAKRFPKRQVIAYEISLIPYLFSKVFQLFVNNLIVIKKDFFNIDLSHSDVIVCYLYPAAMEKLKMKFEKELKNETYVISNTFAIPGWNPILTTTLDDLYQTKIYLYKYQRQ